MSVGAKTSKVFFADLRAGSRRNLLDKIDSLAGALGFPSLFKKGSLAAVKLHFGEKGNTAYVRPVYVRRIVDRIAKTGAKPFLTDTNTLYVGTRGNTADHLRTAFEHGFDFSSVGAPVVIADGLRGEGGVKVAVDGKVFSEVSIAGEIARADALAVVTHFKCHEMTGFGGALKNVGMGCASREGKLAQHSNSAPVVDPAGCVACGECAAACPAGAITVTEAAVIAPELCIGCGHCIAACPEGTINVQWDETASRLQEKMVDHAMGALKGKEGRTAFFNFIMDVSPRCDCYGFSDAPVVPDVGIAASIDPVALDRASADLVNGAEGFGGGTALKSGHERGGDKFRGIYPEVDWTVQLKAAEAAGLGTTRYSIEPV